MGQQDISTALSGYDNGSITLRERDFADGIIGSMRFPAAMYYLWTGRTPSGGQEQVVDAMLSALIVHGTTPSAIASRMVMRNEPEAMQSAVVAGLLGVGSGYLGTGQRCACELQELVEQPDVPAAIERCMGTYLDGEKQFPGIGHPVFSTDPRATRLFEIAKTEGVAGAHVDVLRSLHQEMETKTGSDLTINVIGAMAAVASDAGLSPVAVRGLALVSTAAGLTGAVLEEQDRPIATDIWQLVERQRFDRNTEEE